MRKILLSSVSIAVLTGAALFGTASAAEKICYEYDAHGRLVKVIRSGADGVCDAGNDDTVTVYTYDKAGNRTEKDVDPPP